MSNISMVEANLPPGFRFHPKDEELVCDYLMKKVNNYDSLLMVEVDLNKCEPWDLPESARVGGRDWYFYSQRDRKYATGQRTNRATASGYWKATGKDRPVLRKGTLIGMRKTLVFYQGRAPKGKKTDWVMHEFRLEGPFAPDNKISPPKEDWVLCRVFYKNRESHTKPSMGSCCYDDTGSTSLPALMDSFITFDQTQPNIQQEYEQVPCFSMFPDHQTNQILSQNNPIVGPNLPTRNLTRAPFGVQLPFMSTNTEFPSCDDKAIKAALDYLTKKESNINMTGSPSLGEGSSESYLSDVGIPTIWN